MNNNEKQSMKKAIDYKNNNAVPVEKPARVSKKKEEYKINKNPDRKPDLTSDLTTTFKSVVDTRQNMLYKSVTPQEGLVSQERLQEAILWSEILGKPLCKRRKRR